MDTKKLESGLIIGSLHPLMQKSVAATPDSTAMTVPRGKKIKEHKHGDSVYFTDDVKALTINGETYELPSKQSWVFVPEGLSHGWADTKEGEEGKVHSYHPDHEHFDIEALKAV